MQLALRVGMLIAQQKRRAVRLPQLGMSKTRVDYDQIAQSFDERYAEHEYPGIEATIRKIVRTGDCVLEAGCGTGHWLEFVRGLGGLPIGLDPSSEMLRIACLRPAAPRLVHGRAETLPFRTDSLDVLLVINALHHFEAPAEFVVEAFRVLRSGGRLVTVGLGPAKGRDKWYIYDYFPGTRARDLDRYPSVEAISTWLVSAGFASVTISLAQRMERGADARSYLERGAAAKHSTSNLALMSQADYEAGIDRIWADIRQSEARGRTTFLAGTLHLYATSARVPERQITGAT